MSTPPKPLVGRLLVLMLLVVAGIVTLASEAQARGGPYLEGIGGLGMWTFVETGDGSDLKPGYAFGLSGGVRATTWLSAELTWLGLSAGDITSSNPTGDDPERSLEWSQRAFLLGVRYEPWTPNKRLRIGMTGGGGLTFLDINLESQDLPLQEAEAFTWYLGARVTYRLVEGFYTGADLRMLFTSSWQDATGAQAELDAFQATPLWLTLCAGYRFDVY